MPGPTSLFDDVLKMYYTVPQNINGNVDYHIAYIFGPHLCRSDTM